MGGCSSRAGLLEGQHARVGAEQGSSPLVRPAAVQGAPLEMAGHLPFAQAGGPG